MGKFQALGTVQGHKQDLVVRILHTVDIRHQCHFFQKSGKSRRFLNGIFLIVHDFADQLVQVAGSVLGILIIGLLQVFQVIGPADNGLQKVLQAAFLHGPSEFSDHGRKSFQPAFCLADGRDLSGSFQSLIEGKIPLCCKIHDPAYGSLADAPSGNIEDPADRQIIPGIVHSLQVGQHIPDLPPVVEIGAAHHVVGNGSHDQAVLQHAGLGIGPVENCKVPVMKGRISAHLPGYVVRNKAGFLISCAQSPEMDPGAGPVICPELLALALCIVGDHRVGRVQDILGGPVILLQPDYQGIGIVFLEIQDVADIRPAEPVDGLVVIADHAQIPVFLCQKPDQLELGRIGILVLIHHDIDKAVLVVLQDLGKAVEELCRLHQQIIKIQGIVLFEGPLVFVVAVSDLSGSVVIAAHVVLPIAQGRDQLIFGR